MAACFELRSKDDGQFSFVLKAGNGEVILTSESYNSKQAAENGIASVQSNCAQDERYERKTATNGSAYFTLKAGNHQVIGSSQMYASDASRDAGIESVKKNGGTTSINSI